MPIFALNCDIDKPFYKRLTDMRLHPIPALLLLISLALTNLAQAGTYTPQKVVYHVNYNDISRINATFGNINNHVAAVGEDKLDLKVMIHGAALEYFIDAKDSDGKQMMLDSLRFQGVQFLICGNTLNGYHVTIDDLYDVVQEDVIQAGIPGIIALQQQGYFYVRP